MDSIIFYRDTLSANDMDALEMNFASAEELPDRLWVHEVVSSRPVPGPAEDVRLGLMQPPRVLPPKYFYDDRGARLFEEVCATREYYPTRLEEGLLRRYARDIIDRVRPRHVIELGSGSSRKTRHLLNACSALDAPCTYWPFDVSTDMLVASARGLVFDYPWLDVHALVGDYHGGLEGLNLPEDGARLFLFLGGTIGNFEQEEAGLLFRDLRAHMRPGDCLLLGADRIKPRHILEAAYDDARGVTAAFNRNALRVLNHALEADFDPELFRHEAHFVERPGRIEMHLRAERAHRVIFRALDEKLEWQAGETMRTEISRKFSEAELHELFALGGLGMQHHYEAPRSFYSLVMAGPI